MKIFISYRRFDSSAYAGRLHDRLVATYGENNVFKDVDDIPIGRDFRTILTQEVSKCDVLLVLIGRSWLDVQDANGKRRLDDFDDFVRTEIRAGLQRGDDKCLVVPVLLSGAQMPQSNQLPDDLRELAYKNAVIVRDDPDFHRDMARLIEGLNNTVPPTESPDLPRPVRRNPIFASVIVIIVALVVVALGITLRAFVPSKQSPTLTPTMAVVAEELVEAESDTPEPPIITSTDDPLVLAELGVSTNSEWTPFTQEFDGVNMVLVPAGCFIIGTTPQDVSVLDNNEICFEDPFWIDQTEVSQRQFTTLHGVMVDSPFFQGLDRPVESITWFEARDFCVKRDMHLPTEAEWEYAARGPDGLTYPWGNEFLDEYVVYYDNTANQSARVGNYPRGASWVGALDMSGNVWEWVSSLYADYPYGADHESETNRTSSRVLRGGSWSTPSILNLRTTSRNGTAPASKNYFTGFRCARSID
jgi:formylglycine-generating enzyme required for sulfatase activity